MTATEMVERMQAQRAADRKDPAKLRDHLEMALMHLDEAQHQLGKVTDGLHGTDAFTAIYSEGGAQQIRLLAKKLEEHAKLDTAAGLIGPEQES